MSITNTMCPTCRLAHGRALVELDALPTSAAAKMARDIELMGRAERVFVDHPHNLKAVREAMQQDPERWDGLS